LPMIFFCNFLSTFFVDFFYILISYIYIIYSNNRNKILKKEYYK